MSAASTPEPPYVAVIFTSERADDDPAYATAAHDMEVLAARQDGFLGIESARGSDGVGITVSYWRDERSAVAWKEVAEHRTVQRVGAQRWYRWYRVRVATVGRQYGSP